MKHAENRKSHLVKILSGLFIFLLIALPTGLIFQKGIYYTFLKPIEVEFKKCRSDIIVQIDGKELLIPRDAKVFKSEWRPLKDTETDCDLRNIYGVEKVYWRSIKVSAPDEYKDDKQTWWDWRSYELSQAGTQEKLDNGLTRYEIANENKELYVYEGGKNFTLNKEPIIFECIGLESNLALNKVSNGKTRTQNWYKKYTPSDKYCFTTYLHKSGLILAYSFARKAHKAPYYPDDYIKIDSKMRKQLDLFLRGALKVKRKVTNVVDSIVIHRFGGTSDSKHVKLQRSYKCKGGVTLKIGDNYLRVPRSQRGAPTLMQIRFQEVGRIDDGYPYPDYDCGVEYIDKIQSYSQIWGAFSFSKVSDNYINRINQIYDITGIEFKELDNGTFAYHIRKDTDVFVLPLDKAPTANNEPVRVVCRKSGKRGHECSTSYIHPQNFVVGYKEKQLGSPNALEIDIKMRGQIQEFLDDALKVRINE